jgi:hypothetical protein
VSDPAERPDVRTPVCQTPEEGDRPECVLNNEATHRSDETLCTILDFVVGMQELDMPLYDLVRVSPTNRID